MNQKQELLDKGWEFHDVRGSYPNGIMVSPDLACHDDWIRSIEWDEYYDEPAAYDHKYIDILINSPVFAGDNDWSEHIIEL